MLVTFLTLNVNSDKMFQGSKIGQKTLFPFPKMISQPVIFNTPITPFLLLFFPILHLFTFSLQIFSFSLVFLPFSFTFPPPFHIFLPK
jgi:hypothetical protein